MGSWTPRDGVASSHWQNGTSAVFKWPTKPSSIHTAIHQSFKFGYQVPHDHAEAMFLDQKNGNNKWAEAEAQEMKSFQEFGVFKDLGKGGKPPEGYKKVKLIAVYNVKHDGWHKTRIVAGGHITDIPTESVYSGVVSLRGIRLLVFLAELNGLQAWATDISSVYLQARTKEKLYLIAGPEFGDLEGHTTPCLCTRHYTAYAPQGFDGMNA